MNFIISILPFLIGGIDTFVFVFLTVGFFISILLKEINSKNEYLFYYNNRISKLQLWIYSFIINAFSGLLITLIFGLIHYHIG